MDTVIMGRRSRRGREGKKRELIITIRSKIAFLIQFHAFPLTKDSV